MPCIFPHGSNGVLMGRALPSLPPSPHPLLCYIWTAWLTYVTYMVPVGTALETSDQEWWHHRHWGHQPPSPTSHLALEAKSSGDWKGPCEQGTREGSVATYMDPCNSKAHGLWSQNSHILTLCLSFLNCKMGIIIAPTIVGFNRGNMFRTVSGMINAQ